MKAYHFLQADMRAGNGDEPAWEIGEERTISEPLKIGLYKYGYHASPTLWDALHYAPGPMACLVEVSDAIAKDDTKSVHASRKLIQAVNVERELRLFAADCAKRVLSIFERKYPNDDGPRKVIQAARDFATGKINAAARDAAFAAAFAAARDAASSAAGAAEIKWQREHFDEMFGGIFAS